MLEGYSLDVLEEVEFFHRVDVPANIIADAVNLTVEEVERILYGEDEADGDPGDALQLR